MNKRSIKQLVMTLLLVCGTVYIGVAQGPGFDDDVVDTPVDGGVGLVMAAAAGYGVKKIVDKRKHS